VIVIERTTDAEYIKSCVTHPKIWEHSTDDGGLKRDEYTPIIADAVYWLKPIENNISYGVFFLHPHNFICFEAHTCLLPDIWGRSVECGLSGIEWMFSNTSCQRIITSVPSYNKLALRFAEKCGFKQYGVNPQSYLKNGKLHDLIMLGISRGGTQCQQQ